MDKRGEKFVGLVRVRYVVVMGGEYSSLAMSILPLPYSDYLPLSIRDGRRSEEALLQHMPQPPRNPQPQRFPASIDTTSRSTWDETDDEEHHRRIVAGVLAHSLPRETFLVRTESGAGSRGAPPPPRDR